MKPSIHRMMPYWAVATALLIILFVWTPKASATMSDCVDATCRISTSDGSRGTGCVFEQSGGFVYVLTNAHVVGQNPFVRCEFWRRGHMSIQLVGKIINKSESADAAVVGIPESAFAGVLPKVIPIAAGNCVLISGQTIMSVGCANGSWPTGWKGHVVCCTSGDLRFRPPPIEGRSGSAIFDTDGTHIVALIRGRDDQNGEGIATSVQTLYRVFGGGAAEHKTQACPNGVCPLPQYRLLPYRQQQENNQWRQSQQRQVWPTLPGPTPTPAQVDLSETNRKLDQIAELLLQMKHESGKTTPLVPVKPPINDEMRRQLDNAQEAAEDAKRQTGKLQESMTGLHGVVRKLVGDVETIPDRFHARIDKVRSEGAQTTREVARAYAKDLLSEKLAGGTLGMSMGKIVGGALGLSGPLAAAVAAAAWLVSRRIGRKIEGGDQLLVARLYDGLAGRFDDLRDRLARNDTSEIDRSHTTSKRGSEM